MSYQYIESLSDEAVKRLQNEGNYDSAVLPLNQITFVFPFAETRSIQRM